MRNHPIRIAEDHSFRDGVLLHLNKRDADIVRNWSNASLGKDLFERKN